MKNFDGNLKYKNKEYKLVFNLNVMERIQEEYGSIDEWGRLTDGMNSGEPDAKAVIFGFTEMINEGIDIQNEDAEEKLPFLTKKQVGRMITEIGLKESTKTLNETVINSTESTEKNA